MYKYKYGVKILTDFMHIVPYWQGAAVFTIPPTGQEHENEWDQGPSAV